MSLHFSILDSKETVNLHLPGTVFLSGYEIEWFSFACQLLEQLEHMLISAKVEPCFILFNY